MKPLFISFDGVDGSGKSIQIELFTKYLEKTHLAKVKNTREPGGTPLAEELRNIVKFGFKEEKITNQTELLLMFAARSQHIENTIKPALMNDFSVITDRFWEASAAYQSFGRGIPLQSINSLKSIVQGDFDADVTFILDIDPSIGLERAKGRDALDRIEESGIAFFERARNGYLEIAKSNPSKYIVIDANQDIEMVRSDIVEAFEYWMDNRIDKVLEH